MTELNKKVHEIETREDFLCFMRMLINDINNNKWENNTLLNYLEGIEGWVDDMDGYFKNIKDFDALGKIENNQLDWKILAKIFLAATIYE